MLHILHNNQLLEKKEPAFWNGLPKVGQPYIHNDVEYNVDEIILDTRKGYCVLKVIEHMDKKKHSK